MPSTSNKPTRPVLFGQFSPTIKTVFLITLLVLTPAPNAYGGVDRRKAGSRDNGGIGTRRGSVPPDSQPPCPSESCRCQWSKMTPYGVGSIARCGPSNGRLTLLDIFAGHAAAATAGTSADSSIVYTEVHLRRANLSELPANGFQRVTTRLLDLTGNRFARPTSISSAAFVGLERTLDVLILTNCGLTAVPSTSFSRLISLRVLRLDGNDITILSADVFSFGAALREIYIFNNAIDRVDPRAFKGLVALEKLSLADNEIISLTVGTLSSLGNLTSLDVSSNKISSLEPGWLDGLTSLQWLEVESNQIESIGVESFRGASQLRFMRAENNVLSKIEDGTFKPIGRLNFLSIDLSNVSSLTSRTLAGLSRLRTLNLGEFRRASFPEGFFAPLRRLKYLSLMDNAGFLSPEWAIREDTFGRNFRFRHLNIWLAPIRGCRCTLSWIRSLGSLGTYIHGMCPDSRLLSCPAGNKLATSATGRAAHTANGKHENNRRKYKSGR